MAEPGQGTGDPPAGGAEPARKGQGQAPPDGLGFEGTIWNMVKAAGSSDDRVRRAALDELLRRYQAPMKAFLRASLHWEGNREARIEECLQAFVEKKILEKEIIKRADQEQGRFRDFLKKCLRNFAIQERRAEASRRAPLGPLPESDFPLALAPELGEPAAPVSEADRQWARSVLNASLTRMKADCAACGQLMIWTIFERRRLRPLASSGQIESLEETADFIALAFGERIKAQEISNRQTTADRKLRRCIKDVLAEYCRNAEDIEEELASLVRLLVQGVDLDTEWKPRGGTTK